jgi:dsRNA-specific ribonuclease
MFLTHYPLMLCYLPLNSIPRQKLPSVQLVLEAMTTVSCQERFHMERYEVLGDSVLKYACSHYLYCHLPTEHEGTLSVKKHLMVSNGMLAKLARRDWNFMDYVRVFPYHLARWCPPGLDDVPALPTREVRGCAKT